MKIGAKIRELRLREGLTQEGLARRVGVTPSAVGNYEHDVSFPKEEVLMLLFEALNCTPNELFSIGMELSEEESAHLEKYALLDDRGRAAVDDVTEAELGRVREDMVMIAARKGGEPHIVELKRRGSKTIFDVPRYRGGR